MSSRSSSVRSDLISAEMSAIPSTAARKRTSPQVREGPMLSKKSFGVQAKFSKAPGAFRAQRREGPHRVSEKRPRTFVSALQSTAAAEESKNHHLRDFWR